MWAGVHNISTAKSKTISKSPLFLLAVSSSQNPSDPASSPPSIAIAKQTPLSLPTTSRTINKSACSIRPKSACSDADTCRTADSEQEDPSFDLLEETRSSFSNLSVKRKSASCSRIVKKMIKSLEEGEVDGGEVIVLEHDEKDQISFETVQKIIEGGQVEKLKVEQCKVYLRKHGLRLTGNKDVLLQHIKEHLSILNGEGEKKYPTSKFCYEL